MLRGRWAWSAFTLPKAYRSEESWSRWVLSAGGHPALNPEVPVTRDSGHSLVYFAALKKAGVPVEMHVYAHGGTRLVTAPCVSDSRSGLSWRRRGWPRLE
jgi:acetyl esterase/lipase